MGGSDNCTSTTWKSTYTTCTGDLIAYAAALNSLANVLDTLSPIRDNTSVAHPNIELLDAPEALLAINAGRTIFAYLDSKLGHRKP